jgi:hypothetical protein
VTTRGATPSAGDAADALAILGGCARAGRSDLRCAGIRRESADEVLLTVVGRRPIPTIVVHLPGSTAPYYRRGRQLSVSYRGQPEAGDTEAVDRICDAILRSEASLTPALEGLAVEQEVDDAQPPSEERNAGEASPSHSEEERAEIDRSRWPVLAGVLSSAVGMTARLFVGGEADLILEADLSGEPLRLIVGPRARWQNPYVAGDVLAVSLDAGSVPGEQAARRTMSQIARLLVEHEEELSRLGPRLQPGDIDLERRDGAVYFPAGKLTPLREHLPVPDKWCVAEDVGIIFLTSQCFANCTFCGEDTTRNARLSDPRQVEMSIRRRSYALSRVIIAGHEPLSHPGILGMVAACRNTAISSVELMTTGIPLADTHQARALVAAGITSVAVPLYSHDAITNDLIMRRDGAFDATLKGLDTLASLGVTIHVHSLVLRSNLHDIDALASFVATRWGATFVASAVRDKRAYATVAPNFEDIAAAVSSAPVFGVPFCFIPRMAAHPDVELERPLQYTIKAIADCMRVYFGQGLVQTEDCRRCIYRLCCKGAAPAQLAQRPGLRLLPVEARAPSNDAARG